MHRIVAAALLVVPSVALAGGAMPVKEMGFHLVNLIILLGIIVYFAKTPVLTALKNRSATVASHLEESNRLRKEAQDRFDELDARLSHFGSTLDSMRNQAVADAEAEAVAIAKKTDEDVARIKATAEKTIRDETNAAKVALQHEAVELAVKLAENQLKGAVSAADQDRLARELLGTVKEMNGHG